MAFSMDEQWVYGGQLIVSAPFITPQALGIGPAKIDHSVYLQGPVQHGAAGNFGESVATTMIGRSDTVTTPRAVHTKGNIRIEGDGDTADALLVTGGSAHAARFTGSGANTVYIDGDLYVSGSTDTGNKGRLASRFGTADSLGKVFDMVHPTKGKGWRLAHACIEGPEVAVYFRGRCRNDTKIKLPDFWKGLVHTDSITVQLQPIGSHQDIIVKRWDDDFVHLQSKASMPIDCFYIICGERKDINPLHVEYEGDTWEDYPDPNHRNFDPLDPERNLLDETYRGSRNTFTM